MTALSVNINKLATLRNARGGNMPNLLTAAKDIQAFGAHGITIHPRPDERHIRYQDVLDLKSVITTEYNIEGNPNQKFMDLVIATKPTQVTLVPDADDALTSNAGWDILKNHDFLLEIITELHRNNIRSSVFVDANVAQIEAAHRLGCQRVELYTEAYAHHFSNNPEKAIAPYLLAAEAATQAGIGLNAGHDLSLSNIAFFKQQIPNLLEVSIGHALVCEALYQGFESVIQHYLQKLG